MRAHVGRRRATGIPARGFRPWPEVTGRHPPTFKNKWLSQHGNGCVRYCIVNIYIITVVVVPEVAKPHLLALTTPYDSDHAEDARGGVDLAHGAAPGNATRGCPRERHAVPPHTSSPPPQPPRPRHDGDLPAAEPQDGELPRINRLRPSRLRHVLPLKARSGPRRSSTETAIKYKRAKQPQKRHNVV